MFFNVDKIFVLGLMKNKKKIESKFSKIFSNTDAKKLEYHFVSGVGSTQNDGMYHSSLWSILNHNTIDNISKDIFKNHMDIYRKAKESNFDRILVLEDDAYFKDYSVKQLQFLNLWLGKYQSTYDILYLGYTNWPWLWSTFHNFYIIQPKSPLLLHAYVITKQGIDKMLNLVEQNPQYQNIHIDKVFAQEKTIQKYATFPMIAYQDKDPSLYTKACDKLGIHVEFNSFCKFNEFVSLLIPFILVIILLGLFLKKKK